MRQLLTCVAVILLATATATSIAAADLPEGRGLSLESLPGTGFLKISSADGTLTYLMNVDWILGIQVQATGVNVTFEADTGRRRAFFAVEPAKFVQLITEARAK